MAVYGVPSLQGGCTPTLVGCGRSSAKMYHVHTYVQGGYLVSALFPLWGTSIRVALMASCQPSLIPWIVIRGRGSERAQFSPSFLPPSPQGVTQVPTGSICFGLPFPRFTGAGPMQGCWWWSSCANENGWDFLIKGSTSPLFPCTQATLHTASMISFLFLEWIIVGEPAALMLTSAMGFALASGIWVKVPFPCWDFKRHHMCLLVPGIYATCHEKSMSWSQHQRHTGQR